MNSRNHEEQAHLQLIFIEIGKFYTCPTIVLEQLLSVRTALFLESFQCLEQLFNVR